MRASEKRKLGGLYSTLACASRFYFGQVCAGLKRAYLLSIVQCTIALKSFGSTAGALLPWPLPGSLYSIHDYDAGKTRCVVSQCVHGRSTAGKGR